MIGDPVGRKVAGIALLSTNAAGEKADAPPFAPAVSADGRFLAFAGKATNLDPTRSTGGYNQIFVKDLETGALALVSRGIGAAKGNAATAGSHRVSPDGSLVAYVTAATDVGARDRDIYDAGLRVGSGGWAPNCDYPSRLRMARPGCSC